MTAKTKMVKRKIFNSEQTAVPDFARLSSFEGAEERTLHSVWDAKTWLKVCHRQYH